MQKNTPTFPTTEDYKQFFDGTPVALVRTDLKTGEFLMANKFAVALFGFETFEDLKSKSKITDFYPPEDRKRLLQQIRKKGIVEHYEIRFELPNNIVWVSANLHINCGGTCVEGSMIDITALVELRDKYLSSLKDVGKKLDKRIASLAG